MNTELDILEKHLLSLCMDKEEVINDHQPSHDKIVFLIVLILAILVKVCYTLKKVLHTSHHNKVSVLCIHC